MSNLIKLLSSAVICLFASVAVVFIAAVVAVQTVAEAMEDIIK